MHQASGLIHARVLSSPLVLIRWLVLLCLLRSKRVRDRDRTFNRTTVGMRGTLPSGERSSKGALAQTAEKMHQLQGQSLLPIGLDRSGQRLTQSACCGADAGASPEHPGADIHSVRTKLHFLPHQGHIWDSSVPASATSRRTSGCSAASSARWKSGPCSRHTPSRPRRSPAGGSRSARAGGAAVPAVHRTAGLPLPPRCGTWCSRVRAQTPGRRTRWAHR